MKKITVIIFCLTFSMFNAQISRESIMGRHNWNEKQNSKQTIDYNSNQSIDKFAEGKWYYNSQNGSKVKYGYITSLNTYGLTLKTSSGNVGYLMNCSMGISRDNQYMELTRCMNPETGGGVGTARFYKDRIIFSGDDGDLTYYIEK